MTHPLISAQELYSQLGNSDLIILDGSKKRREDGMGISGAQFFDLKNEFSDPNSEFPNTFPSPELFEEGCQRLGINSSSEIVVYDNEELFSSPRVWWMFKVMGHDNVKVLDGGLPSWSEAGYELTDISSTSYPKGNFTAKLTENQVRDIEFIRQNTESQEYQVIDARSAGRFDGTAPEPRKGLKSGHIPGSISIPFKSVLENGKFKSPEKLAEVFAELKSENRELVFSCGSGVTACVDLLAAQIVLDNKMSVYDGSWTEWAIKSGLVEEVK